MSMIGNFRRVSDRAVEQLRANPERITKVLYPDAATETVIDEDVQLDIDKAWHGIHFLLNGEAWEGTPPLDFIVGGEAIGEIDVGYGPARSFTSKQVHEIWTALEPITREELGRRFDPKTMMAEEIYPTIWDRDPKEDDTLGYLLENYDALREFIEITVNAEAAMIVYIN